MNMHETLAGSHVSPEEVRNWRAMMGYELPLDHKRNLDWIVDEFRSTLRKDERVLRGAKALAAFRAGLIYGDKGEWDTLSTAVKDALIEQARAVLDAADGNRKL